MEIEYNEQMKVMKILEVIECEGNIDEKAI